MAKKMSEITQKDPGIWERITGGISNFFSPEASYGINPNAPKISLDDELMRASEKVQADNKNLENLRSAQGEYQAREDAKLKKMREAQGEYQAKQTEQAPEYFTQVTDKFMKDPITGKTKYGANNAPILNPNYDENAYNEMLAQRQKEANAPGFMQRLSSGMSSFTKENPNLTSGLIQGAAGVGGYLATRGSLKEQEELAKRQLASAGRIGERLGQITATPQFTQQETGLQRILAGGGITPEEELMSQMGLRKAGATAAAGVKAAKEMGQQTGTLSGRGAAIASAITAGQMGGNVVADTEKQVAADAANRKLQALQQLSGLEQQRFSNVQGLAQAQDTMASSRAAQEALAFGAQRGIEAGKGEATGRLVSTGANVLTGAMGLPDFSKQPQTAGITVNVQGQPGAQQGQQVAAQETPAVDKSKVEAAKQLSETGGIMRSPSGQQTQPKTTGANIAPFNQTNQVYTPMKPGQSQGGVQGILQSAKSMAEPLMSKIPEKQKEQLKSAAGKVVSGAMKNIKLPF